MYFLPLHSAGAKRFALLRASRPLSLNIRVFTGLPLDSRRSCSLTSGALIFNRLALLLKLLSRFSCCSTSLHLESETLLRCKRRDLSFSARC